MKPLKALKKGERAPALGRLRPIAGHADPDGNRKGSLTGLGPNSRPGSPRRWRRVDHMVKQLNAPQRRCSQSKALTTTNSCFLQDRSHRELKASILIMMAHPFGVTSNTGSPLFPWDLATEDTEFSSNFNVKSIGGETVDLLFETLADWNEVLKASNTLNNLGPRP